MQYSKERSVGSRRMRRTAIPTQPRRTSPQPSLQRLPFPIGREQRLSCVETLSLWQRTFPLDIKSKRKRFVQRGQRAWNKANPSPLTDEMQRVLTAEFVKTYAKAARSQADP